MHGEWSTLKKLIFLHYALGGGASQILTVTGVSPLTLANAISASIKSIVQTGKCAQASTPTPSNPVPIKCNNGTLVARRQSGLPTGYKLIESMTLNNNCYYEIPNFPMYGSDTLKFSFSIMADCNVIGAYSGSVSGDNYSLYCVTQNGNYMRYGSGAYRSSLNSYTRYNAIITPTGSQGLLFNSTWSELTFTTPTNLCIGSTSTTTTAAKFRGTFYGAIEVVGRAKFLPCERISDSVVGWYDLYSDTFYAPVSGSTNPTKGSYVDDPVEIAVVGTDEVLTVSGKNYINNAECAVLTNPVSGRAGWLINLPAGTYAISQSGTGNVYARYSTSGGASGTWDDYVTATAGSFKTLSPNADCVMAIYGSGSATVEDMQAKQVQVEDGSTATAYQPYVAPQTASVVTLLGAGDDGDTQEIISGHVTRKYAVKVLDGTEDWSLAGTGVYSFQLGEANGTAWRKEAISTHYVCTDATTATMPSDSVKCATNTAGTVYSLYIKPSAYPSSSANTFKAYVASQYAAGTPIIVVYPLAEETTEQVTAQHLHTTEGTNTLTVTAEVSDIDLEVKYKGVSGG